MAGEPKPPKSGKDPHPEATVEKLTVALRIRPLKTEEHQRGDLKVAHVVEDKMVVLVDPQDDRFGVLRQNRRPQERQYIFDVAFDGDAPQELVYRRTTQPLVDSVMNGFNSTVFAYGATGAGKTYTMVGNDGEPGIMVRALNDLFRRVEETSENLSYSITMSYLEIYNEMIRDLLDPTTGYLELREDAKKVQVVGLSRVSTNSTKEVMEMLTKGNRARTMESTSANRTSSRSHALLEVNVQQKNRVRNTLEEVRTGKLYMIDLAGSERASNTQNRGKRLVEGAHINRSLLALGNCINALADKGSKYVNYRDSKLTRLLKDALSGNCRTVMITHISPAASQFDESRNTLVYADRAKNIRNKISRNVVDVSYHVAQYQTIIDELRQEILRLKTKMDSPLTNGDSSGARGKASSLKGTERKDLSKLREDLVKTFEEQMDLRRQLMEVDSHVLTLSIEFEKQSMVVGEWEAERSKKAASLTAGHRSKVAMEDLDVEPAHVRQAWDDLMFIQDEQQRYWDARMDIERQFRECRTRAAKLEEEFSYLNNGSDQRELLSLLCKVHELEIEKMEMQAETLLKEHELRRKDMMILRYGRQRNLCDEIIQRQKVIIDGHRITCPPELQELYDRYRSEVEDIAHKEEWVKSAMPKPLLLPEVDHLALLTGRRKSVAQKLPSLLEENKLFVRTTTASNSGASPTRSTPPGYPFQSKSSLTASSIPVVLPPIEGGRDTSNPSGQPVKEGPRSIDALAVRRRSVRTADRRRLESRTEVRRAPKPRGASVLDGESHPSNPVLHRRRQPTLADSTMAHGPKTSGDLGFDFPERIVYFPPSVAFVKSPSSPTADAVDEPTGDLDQTTMSSPGPAAEERHLNSSSPLAVPPVDAVHHPHSLTRASS